VKKETVDVKKIKARFENNELVCEKIIDLFALLSNKIRFRIVCLLMEGDFCVSEIVDIIQIGKISNISQQLKLLTMSGIVEKRRDKKNIYYHLVHEELQHIMNFLHENYLNTETNCEENCDPRSGNGRNHDGQPSRQKN
jgi:DNA-binding transcriptional ArsR family regulator